MHLLMHTNLIKSDGIMSEMIRNSIHMLIGS